MYGGFNVSLHEDADAPGGFYATAFSFCRVVGGSERIHRLTTAGFVCPSTFPLQSQPAYPPSPSPLLSIEEEEYEHGYF